jgi:hypothetical protein
MQIFPPKNLASWLVPYKLVDFQQADLPQEACPQNMAFHLMFYYIG